MIGDLEKEIKERLTANLIPPPYDEWAKILGIENLCNFALAHGGKTVYVPKIDYIIKEARNNLIRHEYKEGANYPQLIKKYGLSEKWVREICKE